MTTRSCRLMTAAGTAAAVAIVLVALTAPGANCPAKNDEVQIQAADRLFICATNTLPNQPIDGVFVVSRSGKVHLEDYGGVEVTGLTIEAAEVRVRDHLKKILALEPIVQISWDDSKKEQRDLRYRVAKMEKELAELREVVFKLRKP